MKEMTLDEIKKVELDILIGFSEFCKANNLQYFIAYGTLIGAIRHKGFIPWDDDVDVVMPRDDYNHLIDLCSNGKTIGKYKLISPYDKNSHHSYIKVIDTSTVKIEPTHQYSEHSFGVDIDVFPLDGQPDDDFEYANNCNKLRKIYLLFTLSLIKKPKTIKTKLFCPVLQLLFDHIHFVKKSEKIILKYPYGSGKYIGCNAHPYDLDKERFPRESFESSIEVEYEGHYFAAPANYDVILTKLYGDYMTPPPVEKQNTHHTNNCFWVE